jgi:hypothetical protein
MAEALPWIQAGIGLISIIDGFNKPKKPATLSYQQALGRAGDVINPMYDVKAKDTLEALDKNLVSRGFYGQRPGDQMVMNTMGDLESNRAAQIAAMANDLVGRSEANALSEWGLMSDLGQRQQGSWLKGLGILGNAEFLPSLGEIFGKGANTMPGGTIPIDVPSVSTRVDKPIFPANNNPAISNPAIRQQWIDPYGGGGYGPNKRFA